MIAERNHALVRAESPIVTSVRLRARRHVAWLRAMWAAADDGGTQGFAITHAEVDRIVGDADELARAEAEFQHENPLARALTERIPEADRAVRNDPTWANLCASFGLRAHEQHVLALAVAAELAPSLRRVFAYVNDDVNAGFATTLLAARLFAGSAATPLSAASPLVRWQLVRLRDPATGWSLDAPLAADHAVVAWVDQGDLTDLELGAAMAVHRADPNDDLKLYESEFTALARFLAALDAEPARIAVEVIGPTGSGKRTFAARVARERARGLLVVDARAVPADDTAAAASAVTRVARAARLSGAIVYWRHADSLDRRLQRTLHEAGDLVFFGVAEPLPAGDDAAVLRRHVRLPALTRAQRAAVWSAYSAQPAPEPVTNWRLTVGEIRNVARIAVAGDGAALAAGSALIAQGPGELLTSLVCPYTWDDIVLSPDLRNHLREIETMARERWSVFEEWGFERMWPASTGLTAMFAGPSGTGKTMAAQVLARELQRELYRVDLATVVNKYIGETEKRLKLVFDACERSGVVLFFDEADALFGRRTAANDAHDRFANIQIDYLLQRLEHFDGVAVLATNRKGDVDDAFLRRLRFVVEFMQPGPDERFELWRRALPQSAPDGTPLLDAIDFPYLAQTLTMSGADIKSAALAAAFLARGENRRITMSHVLRAARRELVKHGVAVRLGAFDV
jgi:AAA+ superfamily predicted ATPase